MKKLAKTLIVTIMTSSLLGAVAFADDTLSFQERIKELQEEGLTRIEIKSTLDDEGYEMKRPEKGNKNLELTEEQQAELEVFITRVEELKEDGLTKEEIHEVLEAEGIKKPEFMDKKMGVKPELTEEQQAELETFKARVEELKEEGLTKEEISEVLEAEGIEIPKFMGKKIGDKPELTEEQKAELEAFKTKITELKEEGLTEEEIREALEAEGIEKPDFMSRRMEAKPELTEEQQAELEVFKAKIEELKEEGLTKEEIHETLEAEGFEIPQFIFGPKGDKSSKSFGGRK